MEKTNKQKIEWALTDGNKLSRGKSSKSRELEDQCTCVLYRVVGEGFNDKVTWA